MPGDALQRCPRAGGVPASAQRYALKWVRAGTVGKHSLTVRRAGAGEPPIASPVSACHMRKVAPKKGRGRKGDKAGEEGR